MRNISLIAGGALCVVVVFCSGCTLMPVNAPHSGSANLGMPPSKGEVDFVVETVDLIDRAHPIGRVGDTFWGGQYQVVLSDSLKDYVEAEFSRDLLNAGFKTYRYPGKFVWERMEPTQPALHLVLELQALSFSRHPKSQLFADHVVGSCKVRVIAFDRERKIVYQRQCVGTVDTYRPTDELMVPGVGLISRAGLSRMLEQLLQQTVADFRSNAIPEIKVVFAEFRAGGGAKEASGDAAAGTTSETKTEDTGSDEEISF